ncbi:MAG: ATP-binding protein [Desulforhopalus sp.]
MYNYWYPPARAANRDILIVSQRKEQLKVTPQGAPVIFHGDRDKLHQLFINLIDNAIKYNHDIDGRLDIILLNKKSSICIIVSNSGPTIPKEDIPQLFKQFYRVEKSRSQAYGGAGLGLTIAKRIVDLHGGSIEVTSENNYSSFTITLPNRS